MKTIMLATLATLTIHPSNHTTSAAPTSPGDPTIEAVRRATARFRDLETAQAEGWSLALTGCMESTEGAMGYHLGNEKLIGDGGQLDPTTPEALLYEPQVDGSMRFVAVEYLVPFTDWKGDQPPVFLDHEMIPNQEFGVWTLHLWLVPNPQGTFVGWNPRVTCAHASTAGH